MSSIAYNKTKGAKWEQKVADHLLANGVPHAERRRLTGAFDKGDIAGILGVVVEAKDSRPYQPEAWLKETDDEVRNANAALGFVWARIFGKPKAEDGVIMMRPAVLLKLLKEAGYIE